MKKITDYYDLNEEKLEQSFQSACQDTEFKNYVYGLNVREDILCKYTSNLEDSFVEYKNCMNCKGLENCLNTIKGYRYTVIPYENMIEFSYDACSKMNQKMKDESYKKNLELYELPIDIKNASFKNIYKDDKARVPIIKYFKEFMEHYYDGDKPKGIYLNGSFGSGKTYLISSLFNEMAKKGVRSILIYYPEFLRKLKASFSDNTYEEKFNEIKRVPLLLLDDIGAENCSNWSRDEVLGPILQYRMENHLPTFFTSNLTISELEKNLSITSSGVDKVKARRIIERIKQLTVSLELISENRRD